LSIWVRVWVFIKSFANFELDNLKYKKKNLILGYGFEYKLRKTIKKIKIDTQNTKKIENPNPDLNLWVFWVHLSALK